MPYQLLVVHPPYPPRGAELIHADACSRTIQGWEKYVLYSNYEIESGLVSLSSFPLAVTRDQPQVSSFSAILLEQAILLAFEKESSLRGEV